MSLEDKVAICCALSGVAANRTQCPNIPYTPDDYAQESRRAFEAGCTMVHIHAREPDGTPTHRVGAYKDIRDAVLSLVPEMIINFSTGSIGIPVEERIAHVRELKPDVGALNMGSMNYAKYSEKRKALVFDLVFANPFADIIKFLTTMNEAGVKPELECFDSGHIGNAFPLIDMGVLTPPLHFSLILGVLGGALPTARSLAYLSSILPEESDWEVIGISRDQWLLVAAAATLGGNIRVGFEDNFYLPSGEMAASNGDLVAAAAGIARTVGREVATPAEAREMMRLPAKRPGLGARGSGGQRRPPGGEQTTAIGRRAPRSNRGSGGVEGLGLGRRAGLGG
ncbi:MAG: 3-keto-5-aminohexanoate cleavage protein [Acidobacteria bacterium]|nr:3-keto-5-aminohexanoate cleavage protein [Acidobacteriota bacterium]